MRSYASDAARRSPSSPSVDEIDRPALLLEPALHVLPDGGIVLDDENAHRLQPISRSLGSRSLLATPSRLAAHPRWRPSRLAAARTLEPVLADLPVQRLRRDAEHLRRVPLMPVRLRQHRVDVLALQLRERDVADPTARATSTAPSRAAGPARESRVAARATAARRARSRCAARGRCPATDTPASARSRRASASARTRRRAA